MEAHGGYLCQFSDVDAAWLQTQAKLSLEEDGQGESDAGLLVTVLGGPRIVRFAWDAPFTYGRAGARWYLTHHSLARRLSEHLGVTVHAYAFDPEEVEQVVAYANGRRVGGELIRYEDVEFPDDNDDEAAFTRLQASWPLGHVSRVLGIERSELLRIPRKRSALIDLGTELQPQPLWKLFPQQIQTLREHTLYAQ